MAREFDKKLIYGLIPIALTWNHFRAIRPYILQINSNIGLPNFANNWYFGGHFEMYAFDSTNSKPASVKILPKFNGDQLYKWWLMSLGLYLLVILSQGTTTIILPPFFNFFKSDFSSSRGFNVCSKAWFEITTSTLLSATKSTSLYTSIPLLLAVSIAAGLI